MAKATPKKKAAVKKPAKKPVKKVAPRKKTALAAKKKAAPKKSTAKKKPAARAAKEVVLAKGVKVPRGVETKLSKKPGSSNVGKYKKVAKGSFCGPEGGAAVGTYPVNDAKRCRAALSYAEKAPNPKGIRACVKRKCGDLVKKFRKKKA